VVRIKAYKAYLLPFASPDTDAQTTQLNWQKSHDQLAARSVNKWQSNA